MCATVLSGLLLIFGFFGLTMCQSVSSDIQTNYTAQYLKQSLDLQKLTLAHITDILKKYAKGFSGVNYVRYGHKSCPATANLVYDGHVGKSHYYHQKYPGGGVNYLCLHSTPQWPTGVRTGFQSFSYIYGVEYEANSPLIPNSKQNQDVPCAVCEVNGRSQKLMIPARTTCPTGWTLEYEGLLMSQTFAMSGSDYVCVDLEMQTLDHYGASENKNGGMLYVVEAVCGSLPCGPYDPGCEIACVVCTK